VEAELMEGACQVFDLPERGVQTLWGGIWSYLKETKRLREEEGGKNRG